jgi:hypothetical protein
MKSEKYKIQKKAKKWKLKIKIKKKEGEGKKGNRSIRIRIGRHAISLSCRTNEGMEPTNVEPQRASYMGQPRIHKGSTKREFPAPRSCFRQRLVCGHRVPWHMLIGAFVACNRRNLKNWVGNSSEGPFWTKWGQTKYYRDFSRFGPIAVPYVSISLLCAERVGPACQVSPLCCLVSWQYVNSTCNSQYEQIPFLVLPTLDPPRS